MALVGESISRIPFLDLTVQDRVHGSFFTVETFCGPSERETFVPGNFGDGAFWRQVAVEDDQM